jgi:hypothetical protein
MDACHVCRGRSILVRARGLDLELADDDRKRRNVHSDTRHCRHEALSQVTHSLLLPARGQRDRSVCFEHGKANVG